MKDKKHSDKTKEKMRLSAKNRPKISAETRKKMSENNGKHWLGKKMPQATKDKVSKNSTKHWLGVKMSDETKKRIRLATLREKNHRWKGGNTYSEAHDWIFRKKGKAKEYRCKICKIKQAHHWSNKDHQYKLNIKEWQPLCSSCHREWDYKYNNRRTK